MNLPRLSPRILGLIAAGVGSIAISTAFISEKEGYSLVSYQDPKGIWTICHGHTSGVKPGQIATPKECDNYTDIDMQEFGKLVDKITKVKMTQPQRAGLVSFCYNVGSGNCAKATLFKKLNAGDRQGGCAEILKWRYIIIGSGENRKKIDCSEPGNRICPGIWTRRQQEYQLCLL